MTYSPLVWHVKTSNINDMSQAYEREGYIILDFDFPPELIKACAAVTAGFLGKYTRVQDGYRNHSAVKNLACHPLILKILGQLYGRAAIPFQTLNFPVGTQQGTHADNIFFDSEPAKLMCGLWVALEDVTLDCGPLHYYPQSHQRDIVTQAMIDKTHEGNLYARFEDERRGYEKQFAILEKGQAILWASNLLHGGEKIDRDGATRLSQVNHYYFERSIYTAPTLMNGSMRTVRLPYNINKQKFAWSVDDKTGRKVWPHWKQFVTSVIDRTLRRSLKVKTK